MPHPVVDAQTAAGVKARLLPPEEWERLRDYGPFKAAGVLPDSAHALVVVVEDGTGAILACWMAHDAVLLEGLYAPPAGRHRVPVAKALLFGMVDALRSRGVLQAFTVTTDPAIERLAATAGFVNVAVGTLHQLNLGDAPCQPR